MALRDVKLDDKYDLDHSPVFVTGFQALVRICLMQKERDRRAGRRSSRQRCRAAKSVERLQSPGGVQIGHPNRGLSA